MTDGDSETTTLPILQREVMRPTSDRGRLAALATICSLAGVALGFALAGTMFASIPVATGRVMPTMRAPVGPAPAWIGVGVRSDGPVAGAWVRVVRPHSPAAAHGLVRDDVITAVDGAAVKSNDDLVHAVRTRTPGTQVELRIHHGKTDRTQSLRLESMPSEIWAIELSR